MINTVKFAIFVLALATGCLAQEGLTIDNKHKERVSTPEAQKIYISACSGVREEFDLQRPILPRVKLVLGPTRTSYRFKDEKSGLPNGIVTPSPRASRGWPLRISCRRNSG
jgi:hypothetical protein